MSIKYFLARRGSYPLEPNHSNKQDLSELRSDDTESEVCDQAPIEKNCNKIEKKNVPRRSARTNKDVPPFRYDIYDLSV